jgi:flagellar biosynthesis protein FlhF
VKPISTTVNAGIPKTGALRQLEAGRIGASITPNAGTEQSVPSAASATENESMGAKRRQDAQVVPMEVMDEIRSLRKIVEQHLAGFAWGESARTEPVKTDVLRQMLDAGFSPQFSRELLSDLPRDMNGLEAMAWVKGAADRSLMTIGNENDIVDTGGVYALVGPTGVGKTTTTAKLAARCVLRHGPSKVALITTDGYRIGAYEQLRIYGRILGVSVHLVKDANELHQTLIELQHKHMVLIDTMGMSQKDKLVPELTDMLAGCDVQRLLLLNSTSRGDTLDDVVRAYAGESVAGCILTKIDEAASLATVLDVIMRHGLRLQYVSNGQRVPEDLHLPNRSYLLHRAFKDVPECSAHKFDGVEPGLMMASAGMVAVGGSRG